MVALELVNYGSAGGGTCPPDEIYTVELVGYTPPEQVPAYNDPNKMVTRFRLRFSIVGVPDDFTDEEKEEWLHQEVSTFVNIPKDLDNEKATLGLILKALKGIKSFAVGEKVLIEDFIGEKMKCQIKASESGWPRLSSFTPARRRPSASRPTPVAAAPAAGDDGWE